MDASVWVGLIGVLLGSGISLAGTLWAPAARDKRERKRAEALALRDAMWEYNRCATEVISYANIPAKRPEASLQLQRVAFRLETMLLGDSGPLGNVVREVTTRVIQTSTPDAMRALGTFDEVAIHFLKRERPAEQLLAEFRAVMKLDEEKYGLPAAFGSPGKKTTEG